MIQSMLADAKRSFPKKSGQGVKSIAGAVVLAAEMPVVAIAWLEYQRQQNDQC